MLISGRLRCNALWRKTTWKVFSRQSAESSTVFKPHVCPTLDQLSSNRSFEWCRRCVCVCLCVCVCVCVCVCLHECVWTCSACLGVFVCSHLSLCVCVCVCARACACVCALGEPVGSKCLGTKWFIEWHQTMLFPHFLVIGWTNAYPVSYHQS
jgi:hypothetical protein